MLQMFLGAMAALAVAGVAAGTLYMRQHLPGRRPAVEDDQESGHDKRRKDLRRKRGYMTAHDSIASPYNAPLVPHPCSALHTRTLDDVWLVNMSCL